MHIIKNMENIGQPEISENNLQRTVRKTIIGIAKGQFTCPEDIHAYDDVIAELFYDENDSTLSFSERNS